MGTCCGESAENKQVIAAAATKEDHKLSSNKMEGGEGLDLNTVECLRGRLLAERQASRIAKEEAESMGNKLVELENMLREEIKLREKAERKLKFLKKKLESLNISSMSGQSEHSDSSDKCENSCGSSSVSSISKQSEANETKLHAENPALTENVVHNHNDLEASTLIQTHNSPSTTKDCDSQITDDSSCISDSAFSLPHILRENQNTKPSSEDLKNDESRFSSLSSKSSVTENEDDHGDFDNSLALVPVNMTATSQATSNPKPLNESVLEALEALKLARESLQSSMGIRQMTQVGPQLKL